MRFHLRNYRPEDFFTLWVIDQSCFQAGIAYTQFELKTFIRRTTSFTLVAESDEQARAQPIDQIGGRVPKASGPITEPPILGFLVAERGRTGHIITIDVRPEARKHGVGSALLDSAEEQLRLWNCPQVRLETAVDNAIALSFYKRHGYSVTKVVPRYYSNGVDALVLEKDLLSSASSANVQR